MSLTEKEVRYVAGLANLDLTPEEVGRMVHDLGSILDHMNQLAGIDTTGVEPMTQVLYDAEGMATRATLRPDIERPPLGNELALANAPVKGSGFFKVPRVIEK
jgi:aspartyl-tRNA(Asn)/glutamyl-tRNA(Gln) amidotransferase subunit C